EYSTPVYVTAQVSETAAQLLEKMEKEGIRHLPIFDGEELRGMVSDRDLRNLKDSSIGAGELMSKDIFEVPTGTLLRDVVFDMSSKKVGSALVKEAEGYSIFTTVDALNALNEILQ
ncbi:MAG: CBS domain-containing protein, partial [Halobacteriovoraceae bacterium]|nr:CBS domain-containing protein [Halobacteriovoraceae bacterium]